MNSDTRHFFRGLARAYGGAILFALPIFFTMEMWWLGFYMPRGRLALLLVVTMPLLAGISRLSGFEPTASWKHDVVDAFVAYAVGATAAAAVLILTGILDISASPEEAVGKIALQAVPASIGALLAQSQLGANGESQSDSNEADIADLGYWGQLFIMAVGALFFAFNIAPTEEIVVIAHHMSRERVALLAVASMLVMHAFVYAMKFKGHAEPIAGTPEWSLFVRYTVPGYAISLLFSACMLWLFGRTEGDALHVAVSAAVVLAFPAAVGAAAARLVL